MRGPFFIEYSILRCETLPEKRSSPDFRGINRLRQDRRSEIPVWSLRFPATHGRMPNTAVRLGEVRRERGWVLKEPAQKRLLKGEIEVRNLTDDDFAPGLRQKAVDMRIGTNIASLTLKRQVDTIILVAGDADFVPASKLARREGVRVILDPLWRSGAEELFEHIDGLYSGFPKPGTNEAVESGHEDEDDE